MKGLFLTYQQTLPAKLLWGIENIAVSILAKLKSYSRPLWELTRTHMTCHLVLFDRYLVFFLEVIHHTILHQGRGACFLSYFLFSVRLYFFVRRC
jgi:hypothetical protein